MKKEKHNTDDTNMREEYDFSGGVRGKHYKAYREGHTVRIHKDDGTTSVQYFTQEDGAVILDPDVKAHFPDSESVNRALRSLIS
jgi:hypothetical protein